jgi:hypothetical protein
VLYDEFDPHRAEHRRAARGRLSPAPSGPWWPPSPEPSKPTGSNPSPACGS